MVFAMAAIIVLSYIVLLLIIHNLEKSGLRVMITIIITAVIVSSYMYIQILKEDNAHGRQSSFFNMKVPSNK